ncbi:hypothetical protein QMZ65_13675 [Pantoea sp. EABMAA-21]|nr:hypothetical protein [Pantoea sp. EABMAA-21]MDI9278254.1 hypothetical protein [Pantoea sp. EABMAA-21]
MKKRPRLTVAALANKTDEPQAINRVATKSVLNNGLITHPVFAWR